MLRNFLKNLKINRNSKSFKQRLFTSQKKKLNNKKVEINLNNYLLPTSSLFLTYLYFNNYNQKSNIKKIDWISLRNLIEDKNSIKKIEINKDFTATIYTFNQKYLINIGDISKFESKIEKIDKNLLIEHTNPSIYDLLVKSALPSFLFIALVLSMLNRQNGLLSTMFKNESKIIKEKLGINLKDVAGLHETKKDVIEFVDIIMKPEKYKEIGTKIPNGLLMQGPPGTGKTLLAKAVADNYKSNFYLINGSDFIQPIIGTGSKKIKDLFKEARENSPSIIFIDEIDAVGKSRGNGKTIGNDERDNILNSLLVEMDGFEDNSKILVMGATNRVDSLDNALLRPGRFDRIINFNLPDKDERKDIINLYYSKYQIDNSVNKEKIIDYLSGLTFGFNGSQIHNLFNEASIFAARRNQVYIKEENFFDAIDYILLGNEKKSFISEDEKKIIAYHEAGHALVSYLLENYENPSKLSIIPRTNGSLGYSMSIPNYEKKLYSKDDLVSQIMVAMGGRAAEEIVFNKITTGATDDITKINNISREIVTKYGMGKQNILKVIDYDNKNSLWSKNSVNSLNKVDEEIDEIIKSNYKNTILLIRENRFYLDEIYNLLMKKETIDGKDLDNIFSINY